jgi:hypothetical protein
LGWIIIENRKREVIDGSLARNKWETIRSPIHLENNQAKLFSQHLFVGGLTHQL